MADVKVRLLKVVSGVMWGAAEPKVGDVLEVSSEEAEDMVAGGWAEPVASGRKPRRRGGAKAEAATVEAPEER